MAVNVVGPLALTQGFLPRLKEDKGRILHLGTGMDGHHVDHKDGI